MNDPNATRAADTPPPACSTPLPDTSEEYYIRRDEFMRYIDREVNPARRANGLEEIREHEARECFRIIVDFLRKWESHTSNKGSSVSGPATGTE